MDSYEKSIKMLGNVSTVEGFWSYYNHMVRPNDSPNSSDYHIFKHGIKPMWEDEANKLGGKWIVRMRKGLASRAWEELLFALIGEQFDFGNDICGAVVSLRYQEGTTFVVVVVVVVVVVMNTRCEDIISVWNRDANDREGNLKTRDSLKQILHFLPGFFPLEYKAHDASLKDNSSFRNTMELV